jgi:curved DNA-binding protein CbpA
MSWFRRSGNSGGSSDPFAVLGLPRQAELSDDDVRSAWRRMAAATHPDRADGGDPAGFAVAAAAYTTLRTPFGRGEALADLTPGSAPAAKARRAFPVNHGSSRRGAGARSRMADKAKLVSPVNHGSSRRGAGARSPWADRARRPAPVNHGSSLWSPGIGSRFVARIARGRPARLTLRMLAATTAGTLAVLAVGGWQPSSVGLVTGAATWLVCTARRDLAPRR